ncbi:hypothetical protein RHGRI_027235 [Rhododendron griersonianum]|uniref:RNase H type-1 domain-containing protein n=1 Tax=Rhododendron griersonianum TaxID=479676 RepID=A0AAV6IX43_9ERIC|nr:hypothetical protein RHGRI_027235 [Rhododendron griersonianum]
MVMVTLLTKPCDETHKLSALLNDCRCLLQKLVVTEVMHSYREGNSCAYRLANLGFQMDVAFHLLEIVPTCSRPSQMARAAPSVIPSRGTSGPSILRGKANGASADLRS